MKRSHLILAAALLAIGSTSAYAAGLFSQYPAAGSTTYPTLPLTGNEYVPADTALTQGINPATEQITTKQLYAYMLSQSGGGSFRNALIGGDFGVSLWQRGATVSSDIANTTTYYADGWWNKGAAGSAIDVTKETAAADITGNFLGSLRFQRKSANADVNPICTGQVLNTAQSARFIGQTAEFRLHMKAGANFSPAASSVVMTIGYAVAGAADLSADTFVGTPGSLGTWTGQVNTSQTTVISTTWGLYSAVASIPATATQVGVEICETPVGTAGGNDWVELIGAQLDVNPGAVADTGVANSSFAVAAYDNIPQAMETAREQYFYVQVNETAGGYFAPGMVDATNVEKAVLALPVPMRATPTCTYTAGGFKWDLNGTDTAVTTLTQVTGSTNAYLTIGDTTAGTAGQTAFLKGSATTGAIKCSAEL